MSAPVFLVPATSLTGGAGEPGGSVMLDGAEGRHAATVRRLAPGEPCHLVDGEGRRAEGVVASVAKDSLTVRVVRRSDEPEPSPRVVVVQALAKGDRAELAVASMTEVGVDVVVPWAAERSVVQWRGDRGAKALERWRSTARKSAKQARRARAPRVLDVSSTVQVAALLEAAALPVVLHESAIVPLSQVPVPGTGDVVVVVGPEGGVSEAELAVLCPPDRPPLRLGPSVLRTSTAGAVAAGVVLSRTARWG